MIALPASSLAFPTKIIPSDRAAKAESSTWLFVSTIKGTSNSLNSSLLEPA